MTSGFLAAGRSGLLVFLFRGGVLGGVSERGALNKGWRRLSLAAGIANAIDLLAMATFCFLAFTFGRGSVGHR